MDAACINTDGSFTCVCDQGFIGNGFQCKDMDECSNNRALCENGQCHNHAGGYRCECDMGFAPQGNERGCTDIDECTMFDNICIYGQCENVFGTFRCNCNPGYQLDPTGGNCTDIDECSSPESCHHGTCINTLGSYICQCPPNYSLAPSKTGCIDSREDHCFKDVRGHFSGRGICLQPMPKIMSRAACCCTMGAAWGRGCDICPPENTTEYEELCPGGPGFRPNQITTYLEDVDECAELENICQDGRCSNTFGSFMCVCSKGYQLDDSQHACIDIDECLEHPDVCSPGTCSNLVGSFRCSCPVGYVTGPSGKSCVDMRSDLCYRAYEGQDRYRRPVCSHPMSTNQTRMMCCCSVGKAWGQDCQP